MSRLLGCDREQAWYHGSPSVLTTLREGSTITQDRRLAEVFSHQPSMVPISDVGEIRHNGTMPGFLYQIAEVIEPDDAVPHPRSTMEYGKEWITRRALSVVLVGPTHIVSAERLTETEVEALRKRRESGDGWAG